MQTFLTNQQRRKNTLGGLIIGVIGLITAFVLFVLPVNKLYSKAKMAIAGLIAILSGLMAVGGSVGYNDAEIGRAHV